MTMYKPTAMKCGKKKCSENMEISEVHIDRRGGEVRLHFVCPVCGNEKDLTYIDLLHCGQIFVELI